MNRTKKEYSGPFLWLALFSFIIPIYVGAQAFQAIPQPATHPEIQTDVSGVDHNLWDYLLRTYIANGLIDYKGIKRDYLFKIYLKQLADSDPTKLPTENDRLAYYCNAYNAFVIHGVIVHKITSSVLDLKQKGETDFFDINEHILAGETLSLNSLEHSLIRKEFAEPRIHMALVCAAISCPRIRPEAYLGNRLEQQLEDQARLFANNREYVNFEPHNKQLNLSSILNWYQDDFGEEPGVLFFLHARVTDAETRSGIEQAINNQAQVAYISYNWNLNSQGKNSQSKSNHSNFGSGSIPNE